METSPQVELIALCSLQQLHKQFERMQHDSIRPRQCNMMHLCLPEGLRNSASHQVILKSEGGDVWHDAQLRWNGPNQLQPGYTVRHHRALIMLHLSKGRVRVRMALCMHIGSSAPMLGHRCSMAMYNMARSQLTKGLCLVSNCKKHDDQPLSKCLLLTMLIKVTVTVAVCSSEAFIQAAGIIAALCCYY